MIPILSHSFWIQRIRVEFFVFPFKVWKERGINNVFIVNYFSYVLGYSSFQLIKNGVKWCLNTHQWQSFWISLLFESECIFLMEFFPFNHSNTKRIHSQRNDKPSYVKKGFQSLLYQQRIYCSFSSFFISLFHIHLRVHYNLF